MKPGTLAGEYLISSGELLSPRRVTPAYLAQSCNSWNSCRVVSLLELLPANFLFPAAHCCRPVVSLLELLPMQVTPGALVQSRPSLSSRPVMFSWSSCPVVSLLELLPIRVTPGAPACESLCSNGELLSPRRVTPGAFAQSFRFLYSCPLLSFLELLPSHVTPCALALSCHSWNACR